MQKQKASHRVGELLALARRMRLPLRVFPLLIVLNLLWIAFEAASVALLLPIFELLKNSTAVADAELTGRHWDIIRQITSAIGVPITLGFLLSASFGLILVRQVFNYMNVLFHGITQRRTINRIRQRIFNGFLRADSSVQDELRVGEIVNELTVELDRAVSAVFSTVRAFGTGVQMIVYVTGLFLLSPAMTALSMGVLGIVTLLARGLLAAVRHAGRDITDTNTQLSGFIVERLQRARLIRLSGTEKAEGALFAELSTRQSEATIRQKMIATRITLLPEPIALGFGFSALYVGAEVFGLGLETLGLFMLVLMRLIPIINGLIRDYNTIVSRWPATVKINERLRLMIDTREERGGKKVFERLNRAISFNNVSFSYRQGPAPALANVTVKIPAHRMSALIGPSGAGKSTFVDLLPRLRDPTKGKILFDGAPITEFSTESLRAGIAFVPQEPQIFNISAAEHIRYGKEGATDEEVREAARLAGALDFITALPDGFDSLLGDGGKRLSGGQRQRLDIARALVRRAPILILDEPTSALDAHAEAAFRDVLQTLRSETDLTIIVIAHRLSTIAYADQIAVLREGRIEAVGRHQELLKAGGWYADAYRQQVEARAPARTKSDAV